MSHDRLESFIVANFNMVYHHKMSFDDIEMMLPWERHIHLSLISEDLKEKAERQERERTQNYR